MCLCNDCNWFRECHVFEMVNRELGDVFVKGIILTHIQRDLQRASEFLKQCHVVDLLACKLNQIPLAVTILNLIGFIIEIDMMNCDAIPGFTVAICETKLSPHIVQIQGNIKQPIFSCKFGQDRLQQVDPLNNYLSGSGDASVFRICKGFRHLSGLPIVQLHGAIDVLHHRYLPVIRHGGDQA
ncbi:hypothetical protein L1887_03404 [Cichorium endivia]|nr:hypothetical protein L1887_03404 [Cichorium endivia]